MIVVATTLSGWLLSSINLLFIFQPILHTSVMLFYKLITLFIVGRSVWAFIILAMLNLRALVIFSFISHIFN